MTLKRLALPPLVVVSTSKNTCPRFGPDGNRENFSTVTQARIYPTVLPGLDPPSCDDDVLQLAIIFLLGHRGRRSWIARALQVLFGPRALGKQRRQLTMMNLCSCRCLAVGASCVSKNSCKASGCSSVAIAQESEARKHLDIMVLSEWNNVVSNPRALLVPKHDFMVVLPGVQRFLSRHAGERS